MSSGVQFCQDAAKQATNGWDVVNNYLSGGILQGIFGLGASNTAQTTQKTQSVNNTSSNTLANAVADCENTAVVTQRNVMDSTKCAKLLGCDAIRSPPPNLHGNDLTVWINGLKALCTFSGNTQINTLDARTNCRIDAAIANITSQKLTAQSQAALENLMTAKGLLTKNSAFSNQCTQVTNNVSATDVSNALTQCYNKLNLGQLNTLNCYSKSSQSNVGSSLHECLMTQKVLQDTTQTASASAASQLKNDLKAYGLDPLACLGSCCCICVVLLALGAAGQVLGKVGGGGGGGGGGGEEGGGGGGGGGGRMMMRLRK